MRRFVNTLDVEHDVDQLADAAGARSWIDETGLTVSGSVTGPSELASLRTLRAALREVMLAHHGDRPPSDRATEALAAPLRDGVAVALTPDEGLRFEAAPTPTSSGRRRPRADQVIASEVMAAVAEAIAAGTWTRLKVCINDRCQWAYYDHSRNRSSRWCRMEVCGNREKARRHRDRARGVTRSPD